MKNDILHLTFIHTPVCGDWKMNKRRAIICRLQLLIKSHKSENNLLNAGKELYGVFTKSKLQRYKPIIELGNVAVIMKLRDIEEINLNIFIKDGNYKVIQI